MKWAGWDKGCSWDIGNKLTGPSFLSLASLRAERAGLAGWQPICFIDEERMGAKELAAAVVGDVFHVGSKMHRFSTPPSSKKVFIIAVQPDGLIKYGCHCQ